MKFETLMDALGKEADARFIFCGYQLPEQTEYFEKIEQLINILPNTELLGELAKDEVYEWYQKCDCVNGFIFLSENVEELYKRLLLVIANRKELEMLALKGRKVYEDNFRPDCVTKQLEALWADCN